MKPRRMVRVQFETTRKIECRRKDDRWVIPITESVNLPFPLHGHVREIDGWPTKYSYTLMMPFEDAVALQLAGVELTYE